MCHFVYSEKVAYNGWIGSIRSLEEDRITIETEDGKVDLEDEENINSDFRMTPFFRREQTSLHNLTI